MTTPFVNPGWYLDADGLKSSKLYIVNGIARFRLAENSEREEGKLARDNVRFTSRNMRMARLKMKKKSLRCEKSD
ncbi:unnamed protein product [Lupinus luteus]|uniref:Uncharacterized protein n=1 Tax=Lupinus luteus TaxID=3873 RepID=A0AAV1XGF5_LUPLU